MFNSIKLESAKS